MTPGKIDEFEPKYPWPHFVDEDTMSKKPSTPTIIASGWPTVMGVPIKVKEYFGPDYESKLVSLDYLEELKNEWSPNR